MSERQYIAIDLKSFYASVECVERGLDPLTTNLVVADKSRTEKTICLAVSPSLKAYGIGGRARLFEVVQRVREVNYERRYKAGGRFSGKSVNDTELKAHPDWEVDYLIAPPQMAHYMDVSAKVYQTYLKYIAPEDIHVYSIDEVFMDVTDYLKTYKMTAHELAMTMIRDVLSQTGITATAGIGTNMYLCKVATDRYGRQVPKHAHGTANLEKRTSSSTIITKAVMELYDRIVNPDLLVRRINLTTCRVVDESMAKEKDVPQQLDLFTDYEELERQKKEEQEALDKERRIQEARLAIKQRFGKNAILKGLNFEEGATAKERNEQIGGHKA